MSEDYKLILISDNTNKAKVRYRKKGQALWETIYLNDADVDELIDQMKAVLKPNE